MPRLRNYAIEPDPDGGGSTAETAASVPESDPATPPTPPPARVPVPPDAPIPFSAAPTAPGVPPSWSGDAADPVPVVVKLAPGALDNHPGLVDTLREHGMEFPDKWVGDKIDRVMGAVPRDRIEALRSLPGVMHVNDKVEKKYGFG